MTAEVLAAWAGAVGAAVAGSALIYTVWDSKRKETFAHLRQVDLNLQRLFRFDREQFQNDVLRFYCRVDESLSEAASLYLALLNSLDLLAFARERGAASRMLTDEYIISVFKSGIVDQAFLLQFQKTCGDDHVYEHLLSHLRELDDQIRFKH